MGSVNSCEGDHSQNWGHTNHNKRVGIYHGEGCTHRVSHWVHDPTVGKEEGEGLGCLAYHQYTWSIRCCATWYNMPVPLSCSSSVAFKYTVFIRFNRLKHVHTIR